MAESMILHFQDASPESIQEAVTKQAFPIEDFWRYPGGGANYTVTLYAYEDILSEYEPEEVQQVQRMLGKLPSVSFVIEFRRSRGTQALADGEMLALRLLKQFEGIIFDGYSDFWTRGEIQARIPRNGKHFLECYRHTAPLNSC